MDAVQKTALSSLFISYAHADGTEIVSRLASDLEAAGFEVWWDKQRLTPSASWTEGIEAGIDRAQIVLAILSKGSYFSDICRAEQLRALRKNKRVLPIVLHEGTDIPIHLESLQYFKFFGTAYDECLNKLKAAIGDETVTASLLPKYRQRYKTFPPLPPHFVPRSDLLEGLRREVIREGEERTISVTAIRGMGGVGKSVLAKAICHDEAVQDAFPDGVMWVTVGRNPTDDHLREQIRELGKALGDNLEAYDTLRGCVNQLRTTLSNKSALIVLDDVWDCRHIEHFLADAPRCRLLITTRSQEVVRGTDAREFTAGVMSESESRELLARKSGLHVDKLPPEATELIRRSGALPLGLAMLGSRARKGRSEWKYILHALEKGKARSLNTKLSDYSYGDLFETTQVSVDSLPSDHKARYLEMAIFPPDLPIPQTTLQIFWDTDEGDTEETIESWVEASLANSDEQGQVALHDLQLDYVRTQIPDLKPLHNRLLAAYKARATNGWASVAGDSYYFASLAYHLREAGEAEELRRLLLSPDWTRTKLDKKGVTDLIADYEFAATDPDLYMIQQAFQLSAHILARDPAQMPSQLFGRLRSTASPEIQNFLEALRKTQKQPWIEPLWMNLAGPGAVLVFTLAGHSRGVNALAVTEDARRVISGSEDHTMRLWDLKKGVELHNFEGHSGPVNGVVIMPGQKKVVSISDDNTLKVWDLDTGKELCRLAGHAHLVNAVALTADGKRAVSASYDKTLKIWNLDTGALLHTLTGHSGWLNDVCITPDGKKIVSAALDKTLRVWDLESGALLHTLAGHTGSCDAVVVTRDGTRAISASYDKTLRVWDLETGTQLHRLAGHSGWVNAVALTNNSKYAVSASHDTTLKIWDVESGTEIRTLKGHSGPVNYAVITPDDSRVISISDDSTLKVWNLESGAELRTLAGHADSVTAVVVTRDGKKAISACCDKTLKVWDLEGGQLLTSHSGQVNAVAITDDQTFVVTAANDRILNVRNLATGGRVHALTGHAGSVNNVAIVSGETRAVSASADRTLKMWDLKSGTELKTFTGHLDPINKVVITPAGKRAVSASEDKTLKVWDLENETEVHTLKGHSAAVADVAVSQDGTKAVSGSYDKTLKLWNLESGTEIYTLSGHSGWVNAVAISAGGDRAVSASFDHTLKVWNLQSGSELRTLTGHSAPVNVVVITQDGSKAVSGSHDNTVRLWNIENGTAVRTVARHSGPVNDLAITPDGRLAISASDDNTLKVCSTAGKEIATFSADDPILCLAVCKDQRTIVAGGHLGLIHLLRLHEQDFQG